MSRVFIELVLPAALQVQPPYFKLTKTGSA